MTMMGNLKWLLSLVITVVSVTNPLYAADKPVELTPQFGFGGHSEGHGILKLFFAKPRKFHVTSHGYKQRDGTFRLDQTITFQGKPPTKRYWIMSTTSHNKYTATLSDARGSVRGISSGPHLSLKYRIKGPLVMRQDLKLSSDEKTIKNIGVISLLGIPIGRLNETITRHVQLNIP